jgi:hypothetical protein
MVQGAKLFMRAIINNSCFDVKPGSNVVFPMVSLNSDKRIKYTDRDVRGSPRVRPSEPLVSEPKVCDVIALLLVKGQI